MKRTLSRYSQKGDIDEFAKNWRTKYSYRMYMFWTFFGRGGGLKIVKGILGVEQK